MISVKKGINREVEDYAIGREVLVVIRDTN
jgi:hypothetical protein